MKHLNNIERVELLKLDVEGHGIEALEGAREYLNKGKIEAVQFEMDELELMRGQSLLDFERVLPGYDLHRILPDGSLLPLKQCRGATKWLNGFQNIVALKP